MNWQIRLHGRVSSIRSNLLVFERRPGRFTPARRAIKRPFSGRPPERRRKEINQVRGWIGRGDAAEKHFQPRFIMNHCAKRRAVDDYTWSVQIVRRAQRLHRGRPKIGCSFPPPRSV